MGEEVPEPGIWWQMAGGGAILGLVGQWRCHKGAWHVRFVTVTLDVWPKEARPSDSML